MYETRKCKREKGEEKEEYDCRLNKFIKTRSQSEKIELTSMPNFLIV